MIGVFAPNEQRYRLALMLGFMSGVCFLLFLFRYVMSGSPAYLFLNWNLFLAFLPWLFSSFLYARPQYRQKKMAAAALLCSWVLFFPNAPYILTDLFHLKSHAGVPLWYDLVLILAYAWTGLLFGLLSLMDIEHVLEAFIPKKKVVPLVVILLFVSAFGIYLGRYLRWNSWDILREPGALLQDLADRLIRPWAHPRTWGVTLFMGALLNMMYWSLRIFRKN